MFTQLSTWYVITTKEKLAIKAHFLAPWSNTLEAHVTTFARQLDMRQVECKDYVGTVTNNNKVDHFVAQMYACDLFEEKLLDNWEETADKLWGATHPQFTHKFKKERRNLEINNPQKHYERSAIFCETPHLHTLKTPQEGTTATTTDSIFTSAMGYAAALEDKSNK